MAAPSKAPRMSPGSFSLELPQRGQRPSHGQAGRPATHYGIDEIVESGAGATAPSPSQSGQAVTSVGGNVYPTKPGFPRRFSGVPDPKSPPVVVDSGVAHDLIHVNCTPMPGVSQPGDRLIATIFYRGHIPGNGGLGPVPPQANKANSGDNTSAVKEEASSSDFASELPANLAPTAKPSSFPLELPAADSEPPRDGIYGTYVSPICIAAFLHLMSTFPLRRMSSTETLQSPGDAEAGTTGATSCTAAYSSGYGSNLNASYRHLDDAKEPRVVELILGPVPSLPLADLRRHEQLYRFEREWGVEVALQVDTPWRRHPRLVVFDMDSTLITQEVIDMLAESMPADVAAKVADITHRAMQGELQFDDAFRERVRLLTGLPATLFDDLRGRLDVTRGVPALLVALRRLGVRTAVLSGGFQPLTGWLASELGINYAHANNVVVSREGYLTGEVTGAIVGRERKCELLKQIAASECIDLRQVVAVGDGANDLLMLGAAGLGVAWHAKPLVQLEADVRLNQPSLIDLLYLFGFTATEIVELST